MIATWELTSVHEFKNLSLICELFGRNIRMGKYWKLFDSGYWVLDSRYAKF